MSEIKVYYKHMSGQLFDFDVMSDSPTIPFVTFADYETLMKWNERNQVLVTEQDKTIKSQFTSLVELKSELNELESKVKLLEAALARSKQQRNTAIISDDLNFEIPYSLTENHIKELDDELDLILNPKPSEG